MRMQSNRETQLTVELTFKHAELTPFWYGWDGRAFLCFLGRDEDTDLYDLRHVYCGAVDIFGVIGEWAKELIEDACLAHYMGQDPKMQSKLSDPKMQSKLSDPKMQSKLSDPKMQSKLSDPKGDNWGPVAEGGV